MPFPELYLHMNDEQREASIKRWEDKAKHLPAAEREELEASIEEFAVEAKAILNRRNDS